MTMATPSLTVPRFLLPQISWSVKPSAVLRLSPSNYPAINSQRRRVQPFKAYQASTHRHGRLENDILLLRQRDKIRMPSPRFMAAYCFHAPPSRSFSNTPSRPRDHHFDTLKFVQRLKDEGFSEDQSKAMMLVLSDVIEESIQNLTRTMVLREGQFPGCLPLPPGISSLIHHRRGS